MSDPELGKTAYNNRLESIRAQLAIILNVAEDLRENDPGRMEKLALLMQQMSAIIQISDDVLSLERFGRIFKETGELDTKVLEGKRL